jgi:hypothetical protein
LRPVSNPPCVRPSYRVLATATAVSVILSVASLGMLAWVLADPPYWFPGAYSLNKGPEGDVGPRGPVGLPGPEGPVGPDAASAIDDVTSRVDDLESRLDDLETGSGDQASSSVDDLSSAVDDVTNTVSGICDSFSGYGGALGDTYLVAC